MSTRLSLKLLDPWVARLVRRADAGEAVIDTDEFEETPETHDDDSEEEKIEALTEIICRADDDPGTRAAALLVLMATIENSTHPKALAKHGETPCFHSLRRVEPLRNGRH